MKSRSFRSCMLIFILPPASFRTSHHFLSCRNKGRNNINLARVKTIQPFSHQKKKKSTKFLKLYYKYSGHLLNRHLFHLIFPTYLTFFFLYWLYAWLERKKNRNAVVLLFEFYPVVKKLSAIMPKYEAFKSCEQL